MSLLSRIEEVGSRLLSCPTAPYREFFVQQFVSSFCKSKKIPHVRDKWGNIWVGTHSIPEKTSPRALVFVAHMDHPGFHLT